MTHSGRVRFATAGVRLANVRSFGALAARLRMTYEFV